MAIRTIPLSQLETNLRKPLNECADSGERIVVKPPGDRLVYVQPVGGDSGEDTLTDDLLASNPDFQALVAKSKSGARKPFAPR